jgi:hypothetical protein
MKKWRVTYRNSKKKRVVREFHTHEEATAFRNNVAKQGMTDIRLEPIR